MDLAKIAEQVPLHVDAALASDIDHHEALAKQPLLNDPACEGRLGVEIEFHWMCPRR